MSNGNQRYQDSDGSSNNENTKLNFFDKSFSIPIQSRRCAISSFLGFAAQFSAAFSFSLPLKFSFTLWLCVHAMSHNANDLLISCCFFLYSTYFVGCTAFAVVCACAALRMTKTRFCDPSSSTSI